MKKLVVVFNYKNVKDIPIIMNELSSEIVLTIQQSIDKKHASCVGQLDSGTDFDFECFESKAFPNIADVIERDWNF